MLTVKPFKAIRPKPELAERVSSLPYDVMSTQEAREMAKGNDVSFLHIIRSEIDLSPEIDVHAEAVYEKAAENLNAFIENGILVQDEIPHYYIYRQVMDGRAQTGICAVASTEDYKNDLIKKHEFTLPQKEEDRINNFLYCQAHTEPVFLINKKNEVIRSVIDTVTSTSKPVYSFISDDGISHELWVVEDRSDTDKIEEAFKQMDAIYIADGHHRTASSYKVGEKMRAENPDAPDDAEFNFIMAVIFSEDELHIMDYNRLLKDIGDYSKEGFIDAIRKDFTVEEIADQKIKTDTKHKFSMCMDGKWYFITAKEGTFDAEDPVLSLDASILQNNLFDKLLGIKDPRTTDRLAFVGGIRGYKELQKRVDNNEAVAAFGLYPVRIQDLLSVADSGMVMPPKSTWFEPKLRSGLFIHKF